MNVWLVLSLALALAGGIIAAISRDWAVVLVAAAVVVSVGVRLL